MKKCMMFAAMQGLSFCVFLLPYMISGQINIDPFKILITVRESKSFINDIDGLSSNKSFIYLLYTYDEPYELVKLNTSTMLPISSCILPYHYNDTKFRQDFFLVSLTDSLMFVGYTQDQGKVEEATYLQAIDLTSMMINESVKQIFPAKQFTKFTWFQPIPERNKVIVNLWQWDLTTNELAKPQIIGGNLPSDDPYGNWLLPGNLPSDDPSDLLLLYDGNILFTLNISSSSTWNLIEQLSRIQLEFLSKALSFHLDVVNSTTIAIVDDQMTIYIYNLYSRQLTSMFNLRERFPDYPRMSDQIASQLYANEQYVYVTSSTNTEPSDVQYLFRIRLNDTMEGINLLSFSDENFGLTELVTSADTAYSFERLYEAKDYFNIYKIGTPHKKTL